MPSPFAIGLHSVGPVYVDVSVSSTLRSLTSFLNEIESSLRALEESGVIVEQAGPHADTEGRRRDGVVDIQGSVALKNGIGVSYMYNLDVIHDRSRGWVIVRAERSYSAIVVNTALILRCDSGHATHNHEPHQHIGEFCETRNLDAPVVDTLRPVSLRAFTLSVDAWREQHLSVLPYDPPDLDRITPRR